MLLFIIGLLIGGIVGIGLSCITHISGQQADIEDPARRKANRPIASSSSKASIWDVASYMAKYILSTNNQERITKNNIIYMMYLCQIHHLAWTNSLLFPTFFRKENNKLVCCDNEFTAYCEQSSDDDSLCEWLSNNIHQNPNNLSNANKVDIELAVKNHIHDDMISAVKQTEAFINTDNHHILPYRKARNEYVLEQPSENDKFLATSEIEKTSDESTSENTDKTAPVLTNDETDTITDIKKKDDTDNENTKHSVNRFRLFPKRNRVRHAAQISGRK